MSDSSGQLEKEAGKVLLEHFYPALEEKFLGFFGQYLVYNAGQQAAFVRMLDAVRIFQRKLRGKQDWDIKLDEVLLEIAAQAAWVYLGRRGLLKDAPATTLDERLSEIIAEMEDTRLHYAYLDSLRADLRAHRTKSNYEIKRLRVPRRHYAYARGQKYMERKIGVAFGNGGSSRIAKEEVISEEAD